MNIKLLALQLFTLNTILFAIPPEKSHSNIVPFEGLKSALHGDCSLSQYYLEIKPHLSQINGGDTIYFEVTIPELWKSREVFIVFEGINLNFSYLVNEHLIDVVRDTNNFDEWRISKFVRQGINTFKFKSLGNKNTFYQAYLYTTPKLQISNYTVKSELDLSNTNGMLEILGEVRNLDKRDYYKYSIEFALYDAKGKLVFSQQSPTFSFGKSKNKTKGINYTRQLKNIHVWSLSDPYLYTLIINMRDGDDNSELEILSRKIAFRTIAKDEKYLILNGLKRPLNAHKVILESNKIRKDSLKLKIITLKRINAQIALVPPYVPQLWIDKCLKNGIVTFADSNTKVLDYQISNRIEIDWIDSAKTALKIKNLCLENTEGSAIIGLIFKLEAKTIYSENIKVDFPIGEQKLWLVPKKLADKFDMNKLKLVAELKLITSSLWHEKNFVAECFEIGVTKP